MTDTETGAPETSAPETGARPVPSPAEPEDAALRALRAEVSPRRGGGTADRVLRGAPLREPGRGRLAGVCAALAESIGVPVRLLRLIAVLLTLLGPGVPLYLVGMLLCPRSADEPGRPAPEDGAEVPLTAMLRGRARLADALALLALLPTLLVGLWWLLVCVLEMPALAAVLGALVVLLGGLVVHAALRSRAARSALVLAALAHRAGITERESLDAFLLEHRRRAPWAWASLGEGRTGPALGEAEAGADGGSSSADGAQIPSAASRPPRPAVPRPSDRTVLAVLAGMLAAAAAGVLVLNLDPGLAPGLAEAWILPQIGRVTAGLWLVTVVAGIALVVIGLRGRRSIVLGLVGVLALLGAGSGTAWVRTVHDPAAAPLILTAEDLSVGDRRTCPQGPETWSQPVTIDLRDVDAADVARWRAQQEQGGEGPVPVSVDCSPLLGRVTVLLPRDLDGIRVELGSGGDWLEAGAREAPALRVTGWPGVGQVELVRFEEGS